MSPKQKRILLVAIAIIVIGTMVGLWVRYINKPTTPPTTIKIGYLNIVAGLPLLVAQEEGIFKRRGLNVELVEFKTGNEVATAAVTGQIDVIGGAATNAVLDASAESKKGLKIFLINNYIRRDDPNKSSDFLLGQPGIRSVQELRGQKVAIYPGSVGRIFAELVFPKYGLQPQDLQLVELPAAQQQAALASKQVQAVTALEPFATSIIEAVHPSILISGYYSEVMKRVPASGSWFVDGRLPHETERELVEAFQEAVSLIQQDRSKVNQILVGKMAVNPDQAGKVRLLEWTMSGDAGAREELIQYFDILRSRNVTRFEGTPDVWIWRP